MTHAASGSTGWNEFRGPGGSGVAPGGKPPITIDRAKAAWSVEIPSGHSSPVMSKDLVFVTAQEGDRLVTLALNKQTGAEVWRKLAPGTATERVHQAGSRAASTPCVDDQHVYVYFGSFGLLCYDHAGNEVWRKPIDTPKTLYGMSCSPILHGDMLILVLDNDLNMPDSKLSRSKILALNKKSGEVIWETRRPFHRSGWSTPTVWKHEQGVELVVLGNGRARGYDINTGHEKWHVNGFSRETVARPIVGDGLVYVAASMLGGVPDEKGEPEPYWKAILHFDTNKDNKLARSEMIGHFTFPFRPELPPGHPGFGMPLPKDPAKRKQRLDGMFRGIDRNKDGFWTKEEFLRTISFNRGKPNLIAIKPGGQGDATESHVAWALHRNLPEVPSPVLYQDRIYMIRNGGVLAAVNAKDGRVIYRSRVDNAAGPYSASPVAANGHLYLASERGVVSVIQAGDEFKLVHQLELEAQIVASPAIEGSTLYIRTESHLHAFR